MSKARNDRRWKAKKKAKLGAKYEAAKEERERVLADLQGLEAAVAELDEQKEVLNHQLFQELLKKPEMHESLQSLSRGVEKALREKQDVPFHVDEHGWLVVDSAEWLPRVRRIYREVLDKDMGDALQAVAERHPDGKLKGPTFRRVALNSITDFVIRADPRIEERMLRERHMGGLKDEGFADRVMGLDHRSPVNEAMQKALEVDRHPPRPAKQDSRASVFGEINQSIARFDPIAHGEMPDDQLKKLIGFRDGFSGLCEGFDDQVLMQLGVGLWNDTYRNVDDQEAAEVAIDGMMRRLYAPAGTAKRENAARIAQFAAAWAHHAFQKIVTTHTYAAALMASDPGKDVLTDLHLPWRAFMVAVPDGLLRFRSSQDPQRREVEWSRILIMVGSDGTATIVLYDRTHGYSLYGAVVSNDAPTLADLLFDPPKGMVGDKGIVLDSDKAEVRAMRLALRLVSGLLLALAHADNFKTTKRGGGASAGGGRDPDKGPDHRVTFVGKPLKIDLRKEIAGYLSGREGASRAPAVQFLVRGHYKRQVIGVGRVGRKVIWIEPYWKGSEDAPILTKPKLVGGA